MNDNKKTLELVRQRNIDLMKEIDALKEKSKNNSDFNSELYKHYTDSVKDLDTIKNDWMFCIDELQKKIKEYDELINELNSIYTIMKDMGFVKIPLYKKILLKIKNKKG